MKGTERGGRRNDGRADGATSAGSYGNAPSRFFEPVPVFFAKDFPPGPERHALLERLPGVRRPPERPGLLDGAIEAADAAKVGR